MPERIGRGNRRSREGRVFIPKSRLFPKHKVEITWDDGSTEDVTSFVESLTLGLRATEAVEFTNFDLVDHAFNYYNKFVGGETVKIWLGYDSANTLKFNGRVQRWDSRHQVSTGIIIGLRARAFPEFVDKKVSLVFDNRNVEDAIQDVAAEYSELSFNSTGGFTATITRTFSRKNGLEIVRAICKDNGLEFWIEPDGEIVLIDPADTSQRIESDALVQGQNLMGVEAWEQSVERVKNKIVVSGKQDDFVTYLRTEHDENSQTSLWVKEADIFDSSLASNEEVVQRARAELQTFADVNGRIRAVGMLDARPGKQIYISDPPLIDGWYTIRSCSHQIGQGWLTSFSIDAITESLAVKLVRRIRGEEGLRPPGLDKTYDDCIVLDFKTADSYSLDGGASINGGRLELTGSDGEIASLKNSTSYLSTDKNSRNCLVRVSGNNFENCVVTVSNDEGLNELSFTGSELNSDEKSFTSLDNNHRVSVTLNHGDTGSVSVNRVGIYLEHE